MELIIQFLPAFGVLALLFVFIKNNWVSKQEVGNEKMQALGLIFAQGIIQSLTINYMFDYFGENGTFWTFGHSGHSDTPRCMPRSSLSTERSADSAKRGLNQARTKPSGRGHALDLDIHKSSFVSQF